jgi:hypothetical protein
MEYKTISIQRFRSPDGLPTCCANHEAGETCRFLASRKFGTVDACMLGEQRDLAPRRMDFQRPDARCEVWATEPSVLNNPVAAAHERCAKVCEGLRSSKRGQFVQEFAARMCKSNPRT